MSDFEAANLSAIEALNQRGGRMLSLVDLVEAGTLPLQTAALLAARMARGASLLAAAGPGGVGKTTLLAASLAFVPQGTEIVTVDHSATLDRPAPPHPRCLLIHEISDGPYYGYLWGPEIGRFVGSIGPGCSIAATLHAESYRGVVRVLSSPALGARREDLARLDLIAIMAAFGGRRRVVELWVAADPGSHRQVLAHDSARDRFQGESTRPLSGQVAPWHHLLSGALERGIRRIEQLRAMARRAGLL